VSSCAVPNGPSWSDEAIAFNWDALRDRLPAAWLPVRVHDTELTKRAVFDEYGCGSYGCVYATREPDVVFKATSDPTEADFISLVQALKLRMPGVVRYHRIFLMDGLRKRDRVGARITHSALYAIVRESADEVGKMNEGQGADRQQAQMVLGLLTSFKEIASALRHGVQHIGESFGRKAFSAQYPDDPEDHILPAKAGDLRPSSRVRPAQVDLHLPEDWPDERKGALAYQALLVIARRMGRIPLGFWIGDALETLTLKGLILADVHHKNIGIVKRGPDDAWVITDPGHLVRLRTDLPRVEIPEL
jgi:hypothetical protein